MAAFGTTSPCAQVLTGMTGFYPTEPIPYGYSNGSMGQQDQFRRQAERPLCVEKADLCRNVKMRR